ncbi:unnamed protein product, partial [Didymodactylos carnosus]
AVSIEIELEECCDEGYNEEENFKNPEKIQQILAKNLAYRAVKKLPLKVVFTIAGLILVATSVVATIVILRIVQDQHCFRWTEYGQTIAGIGSRASGPESLVLDHPNDLFVDDKKNVYVADVKNHRIQKFPFGSQNGTTVAGGNGKGNSLSQLDHPHAIYVTKNNDIYISDTGNQRVQKWLENSRIGETIINSTHSGCYSCEGLYLDENNNELYLSDRERHRVVKFALETKILTVVAGEVDSQNSSASQLNGPHHIFVDRFGNLFVADTDNHRIQKFTPGSKTGTTVAGNSNGTYGTAADSLNEPRGVFVDDNDIVYVADRHNHRIQKWKQNASSGVTIVGGNSFLF